VGIARYVRDTDDSQAAEIAVTIVDDWQGRGLGTELLARLSDRACSEGIRRFTALVAADNAAAARLLRNMSAELVRYGPGTVEYEITLAPTEECRPRLGCSALAMIRSAPLHTTRFAPFTAPFAAPPPPAAPRAGQVLAASITRWSALTARSRR
jgi:GNAT superfamily N-acetyltransferase